MRSNFLFARSQALAGAGYILLDDVDAEVEELLQRLQMLDRKSVV